jgi:uncharacterized protein (DUF697 family)
VSMYETSETAEWESPELEYEQEYESQEQGEQEYEAEQGFLGGLLGSVLGGEVGQGEAPLTETQEMELATELLEVTNEAELEQFLGGLIKKAASGVGSFMKSGVGRALGGVLKNVAKTALPLAGGALGSLIAPGVGTALGSKLGSMASKMFEVELEGMNEQEAEFEVARRYVRLAASAARNAALAPPAAPPQAVARAAVVAAARQHAPGLVRGTPYEIGRGGRPAGRRRGGYPGRRRRPRRPDYGYGYGAGDAYGFEPDDDGGYDDGGPMADNGYGRSGRPSYRPHSGRWVRRGRKIVILGA